ncbi:MAG: hypothetical protein E7463_09510 [Ruminococcaceae bacterium]|nr:hypothetical protein [Oscillospiraceae bacterium]
MKLKFFFLVLCLLFCSACAPGIITSKPPECSSKLYRAASIEELRDIMHSVRNSPENTFFYLPAKPPEGFAFHEFYLPGGNYLMTQYDNGSLSATYTWLFEDFPEQKFEETIKQYGERFEIYDFDGVIYYAMTAKSSDGMPVRYEFHFLYDRQYFSVSLPALGTVEEMLSCVPLEKHTFE